MKRTTMLDTVERWTKWTRGNVNVRAHVTTVMKDGKRFREEAPLWCLQEFIDGRIELSGADLDAVLVEVDDTISGAHNAEWL